MKHHSVKKKPRLKWLSYHGSFVLRLLLSSWLIKKKWNTKTWFSPSESFKISLYSYSPRCKKKTPARYVSFIYFYLPPKNVTQVGKRIYIYTYCIGTACASARHNMWYPVHKDTSCATCADCAESHNLCMWSPIFSWWTEVTEANASGGGFLQRWWITIVNLGGGIFFTPVVFHFLINHDDSSSRRTKLPW